MSFTLLINFAPLTLIVGGITVLSWLLQRLVHPLPVIGEPTSVLLRIASIIGFIIGIFLIATGLVAWSSQSPYIDMGTRYLLIVSGLALLLKPMKDIPWAAFLGLAAGGVCFFYIFVFYPLPPTVFGISANWIYLLIFFAPALVVYFFFKFIEDVLRLIGIILTFKPITGILGFMCIAQGTLLLFNLSLFTILFS